MISKQKLVDYLTEHASLSKTDATEGIDALTEAITYYLSKGETVQLLNFGTFEVRKRKPRISHNVHSKETFLLKEQKVPAFRVSKALKDKANRVAIKSKLEK